MKQKQNSAWFLRVIQREDIRQKPWKRGYPGRRAGVAPHARRGARVGQRPKSHKRLRRPLEVSVLLRAHTHDP